MARLRLTWLLLTELSLSGLNLSRLLLPKLSLSRLRLSRLRLSVLTLCRDELSIDNNPELPASVSLLEFAESASQRVFIELHFFSDRELKFVALNQVGYLR